MAGGSADASPRLAYIHWAADRVAAAGFRLITAPDSLATDGATARGAARSVRHRSGGDAASLTVRGTAAAGTVTAHTVDAEATATVRCGHARLAVALPTDERVGRPTRRPSGSADQIRVPVDSDAVTEEAAR